MKFNNILTVFFFLIFILSSCYSKKEINYTNYTINDSTYIEDDSTYIEEEIRDLKDTIIYKNQTFNTNIHTVLCHQNNKELSLPIINLANNEKILLSFDDLDADIKDYYFTIIHCNSDWTKSDLMQSEYISGFVNEPITNYEFSFNTIQKYTHYQLEFPTKGIQPLLSGNYIFKIYLDETKPIIYKRFMVLNNQVYINANVRRATLAQNRKTKHEIDFTIKHPNLKIADPFSDIKVHIKQNNREDNMICDLTPLFVKNDELIYNYEDENTFWGNNEFRHFDFKSLRYQSERIKKIDFDNKYTHVYLLDDKKRSFDLYSIDVDINGQFIIQSQEGWNSSTEADYAFVHFSLPTEKVKYGNIYVFGQFSDWQIKEDFKLNYNIDQKKYEGNMYLKQGYYNYCYALDDTTENKIDIKFIEGTHYQTRNDYYIYVYYRTSTERYDQLIGFLKTSSKELF